MRLALLGVIAAGLFSAEVAVAQPCTSAVDQGAFDVAALKSELMLVALSCNERDDYNAFVLRFRPDLAREERALNGWFRRAYGRRAQKQHDDYITNLANMGSQVGLQRGTLFCYDHQKLFQTVLTLRNVGQLVSYAANQNFRQPIPIESCSLTYRRQRPIHTAEKR